MMQRKPETDVEWAELVAGLHPRVPDFWWVGHDSRKHSDGKSGPFDVKSFLPEDDH